MGLVCFRIYGVIFRDLFAATIGAGSMIVNRSFIALVTIALVTSFLIFDVIMIAPNPYAAPSAISLGSGEVAVGGFCGDLPVIANE